MQVSKYREVLSRWSKREGGVMSFEYRLNPINSLRGRGEKQCQRYHEKTPEVASNIAW